MGDPLHWVPDALHELDVAGLRRRPAHRDEPAGRIVNGLVNLSSNDYLDLAGDSRLAEAAADAAARWGAGAGASRLITGGTTLHRELETALAGWKGADDAIVFSSGYLANLGVIAALAGPGDLICSDALNHASIVDACRLSRAEVAVYPHGDVDAVDRALSRQARRRFVVTDGIFSMDGDAGDLRSLCDVADAHGAVVIVDDAHGAGVVGPDGTGTAAAQGVSGRVHVTVGTLSKALGAAGGYAVARGDVVDLLRNQARAFVFDTAPAPPAVAAALAGLHVSRAEPWRRARAVERAQILARGLGVATPAGCVVPLVLGEAAEALDASMALRAAGFAVVAIRPPSVPPGTSRLRFATTAAHSGRDIEAVVDAVATHLATRSRDMR